MELIGHVKSYEWGKIGCASQVAQLASLNDNKFEIDIMKPYAELWMGAHVSGPSTIRKSDLTLLDAINADPSLIGGYDQLPFLFKILSINKALSVQVHPNKSQAKKLHAEFPKIYKDPNHKPELAIALTPFLAMCGFRHKDEIYTTISKTPELVRLLGEECVEGVKTNLLTGIKECFTKLMKSSHCAISNCIRDIAKRFTEEQRDDDIGTIFLRLQTQFPNDVGSLCLFFLNIMHLEPGQAIFLRENEIHAYLDGDCLECMACSDNVIRAGLTPKFKDIPKLVEMLDYRGSPNSYKLYQPVQHPKLKYTRVFSPPVRDFAISEIRVPAVDPFYKIENRTCGSIFIVLEGCGTIDVHGKVIDLRPGSIIFLPAVQGDATTEEFSLEVLTSGNDFLAYQALQNDF